MTRPPRPVGVPTRGTTNANRLRRADRWLVNSPLVRAALEASDDPVVIDLGYGRLPVTTLELAARLRAVRTDIRVVGLEIDPQRVVPGVDGVEFRVGGFELARLRPILVRAFNVLRQYPEDAVAQAWAEMQSRLAPGGLIVDGTCDELGRRCCWVLLDREGPVSLTLACDPRHIERPSDLAERLPKVLIHHNIPGQPIHTLLSSADRAWATSAGHSVFGPRDRWRAMLAELRGAGIPIEAHRRNARDAVFTVPWATVAPAVG
ncbi:class I SAM-dependent methyltransferase [Mycobacterium sp. CVI_P3]|uniref:Class I SAM-dependent methyltransferase n=1 Tax=Mycobacterium pinniadriaticum TaxID=2994102 RepID=A0ABT3SJQ6_9MYCO|nr:class I SAM-dependent methyltransferase [Mycobacterium pinniadriaticum]MCX2933261.1 class I SAM-dependent methyltransferase [Mycobacterium pinniadriaticum]MCX2939683.1 class I SAM-dependent methyltransferase [Mycobacterium pinniadriaticum]